MLAAARPLVDMIWARETEAGVFDTPERRAALEARLREIARAIGDESVRRHYVQAFAERVAAFFPAPPARGATIERRGSDYGGRRSDYRARAGASAAGTVAVSRSASIIPSRSPTASAGATLLAGRAALPLREVVLVMTMVNHPALLARHLDDFAHLEFGNADLDQLRGAILEIVAHGEAAAAAGAAASRSQPAVSPLSSSGSRARSRRAATGRPWQTRRIATPSRLGCRP